MTQGDELLNSRSNDGPPVQCHHTSKKIAKKLQFTVSVNELWTLVEKQKTLRIDLAPVADELIVHQ